MSQKGIVFDKYLITYFGLPNYHTLKKLYFLFLLILTPLISKATHLVGGEMTYTCLGDNLYEIQLVIYRDLPSLIFFLLIDLYNKYKVLQIINEALSKEIE